MPLYAITLYHTEAGTGRVILHAMPVMIAVMPPSSGTQKPTNPKMKLVRANPFFSVGTTGKPGF